MQGGIWQTIADALFWLQLLWVFSGFVLMAYLAFKVFPGPANPTQPDVIPHPELLVRTTSQSNPGPEPVLRAQWAVFPRSHKMK
ncbi:MAG: hypothetical protein JO065_02615 [Acidobacteria bacterium]|nr:hypothetical protein [Acidobacteriota bacterium]